MSSSGFQDKNAEMRFREAASSPYYRLRMRRNDAAVLLWYADNAGGNNTPPSTEQFRIACPELYQHGLLEEISAGYRITDIGRKFAGVLHHAGHTATGAVTLPPSTAADCFRRFHRYSRGTTVVVQLHRVAIAALQRRIETNTQVFGGRLVRKACHRLWLYGLFNRREHADQYGRELYDVTDIGQLFYELMTMSGHIVPPTP